MLIKITHKEMAEIPGLPESAMGGYMTEDGEIYKLFGQGNVRRLTSKTMTKGAYAGKRLWTSKNIPLRISLLLASKVGE